MHKDSSTRSVTEFVVHRECQKKKKECGGPGDRKSGGYQEKEGEIGPTEKLSAQTPREPLKGEGGRSWGGEGKAVASGVQRFSGGRSEGNFFPRGENNAEMIQDERKLGLPIQSGDGQEAKGIEKRHGEK